MKTLTQCLLVFLILCLGIAIFALFRVNQNPDIVLNQMIDMGPADAHKIENVK